MRILLGHRDTPLPPYDTARYDVRCIRTTVDRQRTAFTLAEMLAQCPPGWKPDVYYHSGLVHNPVPADIEEFDGLTATDIQDWHRGGRAVWATAGFFDLIAAERNACALLQAGGYENAVFARLWGVNPELHRVLPDVEKDIDILFIGSLNADVWEERNRWLDRIARLSDRYRVLITAGHYGEDYVRLTNRAKIVFNRSVNGCTNQRAYDGPACGALVFNEAEGEETREVFQDGVHCVYYNAENLEERLDYYLTHDAERECIVAAGRKLVLEQHTESAHINTLFALLEANQDKKGYRPNARQPRAERCLRKALQLYSCALPAASEPALKLLDEAEQEGSDRNRLLEARAALQGWVAHYLPQEQKVSLLTAALNPARQAAKARDAGAIAPMTWAFLLLERAEATQGAHPTGRNDIMEAAVALALAAERCETARALEAASYADIEGFGYPRWNDSFDCFRERASLLHGANEVAWAEEMRAVIAWRCRSMLSDLALANEQREEAYRQAFAAAQNRPRTGEALLRLARCEAMVGLLEDSITHYAAGLALSPFTYEVWPELVTALAALGRRAEAEAFVADRLKILNTIPSFAAIRPLLVAALSSHT